MLPDRARARRGGRQVVRRRRCPPSSCARSRRAARSSSPSCASAGRSTAARLRVPGRRCSATTNGAPEVFTAWHYARFVEALVVAGKKRYDIPLYVNAALNRTGRKPGEYPSGGPLPHLLDVWKAGAPTTRLPLRPTSTSRTSRSSPRGSTAPTTCCSFPKPTTRPIRQGPANAFFSFGELDSLGFSPFSIESLGDAPNALSRVVRGARTTDAADSREPRRGRMAGFRATIQEDGTVIDTPVKKMLGGIEFTVTFIDPWTPRDKQTIGDHGGLLIHAGGEDFWFAGQGITSRSKARMADRRSSASTSRRKACSTRKECGLRAAGSTAIRRTRAGTSGCRRAVPDSEGAALPLSMKRGTHRETPVARLECHDLDAGHGSAEQATGRFVALLQFAQVSVTP